MYRATVGPSRDGEYYQLGCQGMRSIAGDMKEHSLHDVNKGSRESGLINPTTPLPEYAGGGAVGLLVGNQDVQLDPILLGTLPSRIGVYQCPFVDIWGSSLAFAGPHPSFQPTEPEIVSTSMMIHLMNPADQPKRHGRRHRRSRRNPCLCHSPARGWGVHHHRHL